MKKFIVVLLALAMLLAMTACGKKEEQESIFRSGHIDGMMDQDALIAHIAEKHPDMPQPSEKATLYNNLSAALLALDSGEITAIASFESVANYVVSHNDKYGVMTLQNSNGEKNKAADFSMMTTAANTELHGILDNAIKQLKADGTLDQLVATHITAGTQTDPTPAALPTFEGAKTYKIAVTGDVPPMDFVTADGHAAGFNVALLSAIADIAQVNFELVTVDAGARLTALTTGKVDAIFWTTKYDCQACNQPFSGTPDGTLITEAYFEDYAASIMLKPAA